VIDDQYDPTAESADPSMPEKHYGPSFTQLAPIQAQPEPNAPQLTQEQAEWLSWRLSTNTDAQAIAQMTRGAEDPMASMKLELQVENWMREHDFRAAYDAIRYDKRLGFQSITAAYLPMAARALARNMNCGNPKIELQAVQLLLRAHGMLVDTVKKDDPGAVQNLIELLRQRVPVKSLES
jgi:hypothetical protein